jgi:hypothetical protein
MFFERLVSIIEKYGYHCAHDNSKVISLLISDKNTEWVNTLREKYKKIIINPELQSINSCITIINYENLKYSDQILAFINKYVKGQITLILIVPLKFDFHYFAKNIETNEVDIINYNTNGKKDENYFIVIKNN